MEEMKKRNRVPKERLKGEMKGIEDPYKHSSRTKKWEKEQKGKEKAKNRQRTRGRAMQVKEIKLSRTSKKWRKSRLNDHRRQDKGCGGGSAERRETGKDIQVPGKKGKKNESARFPYSRLKGWHNPQNTKKKFEARRSHAGRGTEGEATSLPL